MDPVLQDLEQRIASSEHDHVLASSVRNVCELMQACINMQYLTPAEERLFWEYAKQLADKQFDGLDIGKAFAAAMQALTALMYIPPDKRQDAKKEVMEIIEYLPRRMSRLQENARTHYLRGLHDVCDIRHLEPIDAYLAGIHSYVVPNLTNLK